jgi:hypothetical protein
LPRFIGVHNNWDVECLTPIGFINNVYWILIGFIDVFFSFANLRDELDINQQKMMGLTNNNEEFGFSFTHTVWVYQGYTGCNRDIMLTYVYTSVLSMGTMI